MIKGFTPAPESPTRKGGDERQKNTRRKSGSHGCKTVVWGFTLIEVLVVLGIIVFLAGMLLIIIDPVRYLARARNDARRGDVIALRNAVGERMADNGGAWNQTCGSVTTILPLATTTIGTSPGFVNLEPCLTPAHLPLIPVDPEGGTSADTKYQIIRYATSGLITVGAPNAELEEVITVTR